MKIRNNTQRPAAIGKTMLQVGEETEVNPVEFLKDNLNPDDYLRETVERLHLTIVDSTPTEIVKEKEPEPEPPKSEETKKKKGGKI